MTQEVRWMLQFMIRSFHKQLLLWRRNLAAWRRFWQSYRRNKQLALSDRQPSLKDLYPYLGEDTAYTPIAPVYFYQDTWAFEKIVGKQPSHHVDVGSYHKFVAFLSRVVPVTMVDLRPLSLPIDSLEFQRGSIVDMPFDDNSLPSVSCLCVIEHIGLG